MVDERVGKVDVMSQRITCTVLAEIVLVLLNALLDPQQHGGVPLIQPCDRVELFHLKATTDNGGSLNLIIRGKLFTLLT